LEEEVPNRSGRKDDEMSLKRRLTSLGVSVCVLLLAACAPAGSGIPVTGETIPAETPTAFPNLPPKAVLDAQQWLATQLNVAIEQVEVIEVEQAEWPDSCLELGRPDESCAAVITPGWRAVVEVNGQRYEVRTDETASTIRLTSPEGILPSETGLENSHWSLVSFGLRGAEKPLVEESTITLMLAAGLAGGSGGCNSYGGIYEVEGNRISFREITSTLRACSDQRVTDQEQRYFAALETAESYEVDGNLLRIAYDGGAGQLVFESALPTGSGEASPTVETPGG
jgi:heat shock protein HslJ